LYPWDLEAVVIDQVKTLPILLESSKVFTNIIPFFSSSMPEVSDDCNSSFLAFVLIDSLKIFPGGVRGRAVLDVDDRFVAHVLSDEVLCLVVVLLPVIMASRIFFLIWLLDFAVNIGLNFT
jgi:hypothetical protein